MGLVAVSVTAGLPSCSDNMVFFFLCPVIASLFRETQQGISSKVRHLRS